MMQLSTVMPATSNVDDPPDQKDLNYADKECIELVRNGDEQAFEVLFMKYYSSLVNFAFSYLKCIYLSEEVIQDVFADCWEGKKQLDPEKNIKSYLFQSTKFKSLDLLKHKDVENRYRKEMVEINKDHIQPEPPDDSVNEVFEKAVQTAIQSLPKRAQQVYVLHRKERLTYKEIAEVMGISPKTVESQMSRALKILRIRLDKYITV